MLDLTSLAVNHFPDTTCVDAGQLIAVWAELKVNNVCLGSSDHILGKMGETVCTTIPARISSITLFNFMMYTNLSTGRFRFIMVLIIDGEVTGKRSIVSPGELSRQDRFQGILANDQDRPRIRTVLGRLFSCRSS
jgi:hypothetical protein